MYRLVAEPGQRPSMAVADSWSMWLSGRTTAGTWLTAVELVVVGRPEINHQ